MIGILYFILLFIIFAKSIHAYLHQKNDGVALVKRMFLHAFLSGIILLAIYFLGHNLWGTTFSEYIPRKMSESQTTEMNILNNNFQKWGNASVKHYRFSLAIGCHCGFFYEQPLTIEVLDGKAISFIDNKGVDSKNFIINEISDHGYKSFWRNADLYTLEGLFSYAKITIMDAEHVDIEYDSNNGFPSYIRIDWDEEEYHDKQQLTVTNFGVLP